MGTGIRIAVVGGGIAGCGAAAALGRLGLEVEVFEREPSIREIGAGLSLWPNATWALRELGLLEPCLRVASRVESIRLQEPSGRRWASIGVTGHPTPAICLDRPSLLSVLHADLDRRRIHTGQACLGVGPEAPGARRLRVRLAGGRSPDFDAVIGADGVGSVVRDFVAGSPRPPVYRGYMIWRGVAELLPSPYAEGTMTETWGRGERFGIMPIGRGRVCWYATRNRAEPADVVDKAGLLERFRSWHPPIPEVLAATPEAAIIPTPALDRPPAWRWARGRAVLIGDAAHPMTPNLGQGTCQAIEDVFALYRLLAAGGPLEDAFRRLQTRRRARAAAIVLGARWLGGWAQSEGRAAGLLRAALPGPLLSSALRRTFHALHAYETPS